MAYRSSVHESTCFTPKILVLSHKLLLLLNLIYPHPETKKPTDVNEHVMQNKLFSTSFSSLSEVTLPPNRNSEMLYLRRKFMVQHTKREITSSLNKLSKQQVKVRNFSSFEAREQRSLGCNLFAALVSLSVPARRPTPSPLHRSPPSSPAVSMTSHVLPSTLPRFSPNFFNSFTILAKPASPFTPLFYELTANP